MDFLARPISLSQLSDRQMSEETGPRVVCVQGFSGMQEAHIKSVRELLGPRVYLIFRVDNNDFETAPSLRVAEWMMSLRKTRIPKMVCDCGVGKDSFIKIRVICICR